MRETIQALNRLLEEGYLLGYAIAGAFASLFYVEPIVTFDLDLPVMVPNASSLAPFSTLYRHLAELGYPADHEHVLIEQRPVQFLLPYNNLVREAFETAREDNYDGVPLRVVRPEYLMAMMVQTGRTKDKQRLLLFLDEATYDKDLFHEILTRYDLGQRCEEWTKNSTSKM